jgi:arylsulfatase A
MKHRMLIFTTLLLAALAAARAVDVSKPAQPNIVLILADDLGVGDVQCYFKEGKIPTPNLDRLASQGMRFTDAHSGSAVCTPTRYGLLTGRYAWRTRLRTGVLQAYDPPLIAKDRLTLPSMLRQQGYTTACIGKWHLGWNWPAKNGKKDFTQPIANGPITRGFDYYFGTHVPNQPPYCFIENDRTIGVPSAMLDPRTLPAYYHVPNAGPMLPGWKFDEILPKLDEKAVSYIGARAKDKKPFFLYFALTSPHEPVAPAKQWQGKSGINPVADFIMQTDAVVGDVLKALETNGLAGNTLLIFTADNGHCPYTGLEQLLKHGHYPSGPYRGYKADIWEGGHHEPFIAQWPGKIKPGTTCNDIICLTDLMATCADITGAKIPDDAGEDSVSILPALLGTATAPVREAIVHQGLNGALAIRQGKWKLEFCPGSNGYGNAKPNDAEARKKGLSPIQLYDMSQDSGEKRNVQAEHPEIVKQLTQLLQKYVDDGRSTPGAKQKNDVPVRISLEKEPKAASE